MPMLINASWHDFEAAGSHCEWFIATPLRN